MIKTLRSAFAPNAGLKSIPVVKTLCDCLDSIYIRRGGTDEQVAEALKVIKDRQDKIEDSEHYNPLLLFPEGGTTNGRQLMKFRKGAFFSEKTVKPIFIKYLNSTLSVAFDTIEFLPLAILMLSWGCTTCNVTIMPDFKPNDHLFQKHADKGEERWQVYAWAVRDAISKAGKFELCESKFREKLAYEKYMQMEEGADLATVMGEALTSPAASTDEKQIL